MDKIPFQLVVLFIVIFSFARLIHPMEIQEKPPQNLSVQFCNALKKNDVPALKNLAPLLKEKGLNVNGFVIEDNSARYPILHFAVKEGFTDMVKILVEQCGCATHFVDCEVGVGKNDEIETLTGIKGKQLALYLYPEATVFACYYGRLEILKYLLNRDAFMDDKLLENAARGNQLAIIKYLIEGKKGNDRYNMPISFSHQKLKIGLANALYYAYKKNYKSIAEYLIKNGAQNDLFEKKNLSVQFCKAVKNNDVLALKSLAPLVKEKSIDVDELLIKKDNDPTTLLHFAVKEGFTDMVKLLVELYNTDMENDFVSLATRYDRVTILKYLIEERKKNIYGTAISFNGEPASPKTALYYARKKNYKDIVEYLVKNDAEDGPLNPKTLYTKLCSAVKKNDVLALKELAPLLKQKGLDVNSFLIEENNKKYPLLHFAVKEGFTDMVKVLIEQCGAAVDFFECEHTLWKDNEELELAGIGDAPSGLDNYPDAIIFACYYGRLEILKYLIEKDAMFDEDLILLAARRNQQAILKYLIEEQKVDICRMTGYDQNELFKALAEHGLKLVEKKVPSSPPQGYPFDFAFQFRVAQQWPLNDIEVPPDFLEEFKKKQEDLEKKLKKETNEKELEDKEELFIKKSSEKFAKEDPPAIEAHYIPSKWDFWEGF